MQLLDPLACHAANRVKDSQQRSTSCWVSNSRSQTVITLLPRSHHKSAILTPRSKDLRVIINKSAQPTDEDAIPIQELLARVPPSYCDPDNVVKACICNGSKDSCPCKPHSRWSQINELFKIARPKTFAPLPPIFIQDEKGDYLLLEQDESRKLFTTPACLCKDGTFTSDCKGDCTITNPKQLAERDEL